MDNASWGNAVIFVAVSSGGTVSFLLFIFPG
jgi:hypothetical protein